MKFFIVLISCIVISTCLLSQDYYVQSNVTELAFPSREYNQGFDHGERDRLAERPKANLSGKSADYKQGYEHGYTGVSQS